MIHVPQQLNFSQSAFRIDLIVERVADLLDGNLLASLRIDSSTGQKEYMSNQLIIINSSVSHAWWPLNGKGKQIKTKMYIDFLM